VLFHFGFFDLTRALDGDPVLFTSTVLVLLATYALIIEVYTGDGRCLCELVGRTVSPSRSLAIHVRVC